MNTSLIEPGCLCFDLGAHHGESAAVLLEAGAGQVLSVEACHANYTKLVERWQGDPRVLTLHAAVMDVPGLVTLSRAAQRDGLSTIYPEKWAEMYSDADYQPPELVPAVNLSLLMERFGVPHFLKVDVEGAELPVLLDLEETPQYVSFEFHGRYMQDARDCLDLLRSRGYTKAIWYPEDLDLARVPTRSIMDVRDDLWAQLPGWGNIVVG